MLDWLTSLFGGNKKDKGIGIDPYEYHTYSYLTDSDPLDVIEDDSDYEADAYDTYDSDYGSDYDYD
jgi:hypothetical protein